MTLLARISRRDARSDEDDSATIHLTRDENRLRSNLSGSDADSTRPRVRYVAVDSTSRRQMEELFLLYPDEKANRSYGLADVTTGQTSGGGWR